MKYLSNKYNYFDKNISEYNKLDKYKLSELLEQPFYNDFSTSSILVDLKLEKIDDQYFFNLYHSSLITTSNPDYNTKFLCNGLVKEFLFNNQDEFKINTYYYIPEKIFLIKFIAVYTDIIEEQFLGDVSAPVLHIIPIETQSSSQIINVDNNTLHYVPVNKNYINSIKIVINDLQGNQIRFDNDYVYVIVKLHFRKTS